MLYRFYQSIFFIVFSLFFVNFVQAQGLSIGSPCARTADCGKDTAGVDLGCRPANLGNYNICKIVSAGATGCSAAPAGENWCGDNLICYKNICAYDYLVSPTDKLPVLGGGVGSSCNRTADCGKDSNNVDLGCRFSDIGKYQICKIVSQGAEGCSQTPLGENFCGDNLVCKSNKCYYDWEEPDEIKSGFLSKILIQIKIWATWENIKKILPLFINLILSIALICGIVLFLKGYMKRQYCQDYEPDLHQGLRYMTAGGIIVGLAVALGIMMLAVA